MKILIIEDEEKIAQFIQTVLTSHGMKVTICASAEEVLANNYETNHDVILLDLLLPGKQGKEFVQDMRKKKLIVPIIIISALTQTGTKIDLLNLGADDYMTKPFDAEELLARIEAVYRRYLEFDNKEVIQYADITFYPKQNKVIRADKSIILTKKESELLEYLLQKQEHTIRNDDILRKIWRAKTGYHSNIIQATVRRLRKKIDSGFSEKLIHSIHGVGYSLSTNKK